MIPGSWTLASSLTSKPRASGDDPATDTKVRAIVGDFRDGIRWGVQRELPIELIRFGDPDGQGDLKRHNGTNLSPGSSPTTKPGAATKQPARHCSR